MTFLSFLWWLSIFWPSVLCYSALRSFLLLCSWISLKIIRLFFYSTVFMLCCSVLSNSLRPSWTEAHQAPLHGIFPARILEWVAISSSRESSWPRDRSCVSCVSCIAGRFSTRWAIRKALSPSCLHGTWLLVVSRLHLISLASYFLFLFYSLWFPSLQSVPSSVTFVCFNF